MNLLITSISQKVPFIEKMKDAANRISETTLVYGGDGNGRCLGRYFVDEFWHMPVLSELSVDDFILYCKQKDIRVIFPTRDGELTYFSRNLNLFNINGIRIMVSDYESLAFTRDKLNFFLQLKLKRLPVIQTVLDIDSLESSLFVVKEQFGSGSQGLYLKVQREEAVRLAESLDKPIFQPYIEGTEYSIDVYVDFKGKSKGAVVRERVLVVNGESQVTRTVRDERLEQLGLELAETLGLHGHVMFQVIVDSNGSPHIVECNPRFGGASTLSVAAGLDSFYWFLLEAQGESLENYPFIRSEKELTQVRYAKDMIF